MKYHTGVGKRTADNRDAKLNSYYPEKKGKKDSVDERIASLRGIDKSTLGGTVDHHSTAPRFSKTPVNSLHEDDKRQGI